MRLISVNVGRPRTVAYQGRRVRTAIDKTPVTGPVHVGRLNLDGDGQADRRFHGGEDKAVYAYPSEHYAYWTRELGRELPWGHFGENFTVEGLLEDEVCIGDVLRVGDVRLEVTQPRTPCFKLAMKMGIDDFVERFAASRRIGFYSRVLTEGSVAAGCKMVRDAAGEGGLTVREAFRLSVDDRLDVGALQRALSVPALPASWKRTYRKRLESRAGDGSSTDRRP